MSSPRTIYAALLVLLAVILAGTVGYIIIEGASPLDACYMTVITITTVGYNEAVDVRDPAGRIFTIILILAGLAAWTFFVLALIAFFVEGDFLKKLRLSRTQKRIKAMHEHYIICGTGQAGTAALAEFRAVSAPVVVIERDPDIVRDLTEKHNDLLVINGDATTDETLTEAGVERAAGLIAATEDDSHNLLIVLTARSKNPRLRITSRATRTQNVGKLMIAGANHVVMPNMTGGIRMAATLLRPDAINFLELMIRGSGDLLRIEQVPIPAGSPLVGRTLMDAAIPNRTGLLVLAIKHEDGEDTFNPKPIETFRAGDILIVMGRSEQLPELKKMAGV